MKTKKLFPTWCD